tara:strand:+ start:3129 stop:3647 length:519 start_codon:yes stop_codon:yes gene_type:complete
MTNWKNFVSEFALGDVLSDVNELVGATRKLETTNLESVAESAYAHYSTYMDNSELPNALLWDIQEYANYATGLSGKNEYSEKYASLLPSGHPDSENPEALAAAAWIAGDASLSPSASSAIIASLAPSDDVVKVVHATARMKALIASGDIPEETSDLIYDRITKITSFPSELL